MKRIPIHLLPMLTRVIRDEFDNCNSPDEMELAIQTARYLHTICPDDTMLILANDMQCDYESDYPSASDDYDPNWQENAGERELNRNYNPNRL